MRFFLCFFLILLCAKAEERILSFDSYNRGALMIHALHTEMGDEAFFAGLRAYVERYGGQSVGQDAFETVMEEAAGRELDVIWDAWLANGG